MYRRGYMGLVAAIVLAGCSGAEYTNPPEHESFPEFLELVDHSIELNDGSQYSNAIVTGTIENIGEQRLALVEIRTAVYDETDLSLDSHTVSKMHFEPGETWDFEVELILQDTRYVDRYDIGISDVLEADVSKALENQSPGENIERFDGLQLSNQGMSVEQIEYELKDDINRVVSAGLVLEGDETIEAYRDIEDQHGDVLQPVDGEEAYFDIASVHGLVENTLDIQMMNVEVRVRVYDENDSEIYQERDSTEVIEAGSTWEFNIPIPIDVRDIASYDLAVIGRP